MDSIYKGDLVTRRGRRNAWIDALFVDHAILRLYWTNLSVVKPGILYRSNHPTPGNLAKFKARLGLRSLINLRGKTWSGSDALSREAAAKLGLDFFDMAFESRGAPHKDRILRLANILASMRPPALVHCKSGADRAGLASALFVAIEGGSADEALKQLSWRFGHIKQSKTGILDAFFLTFKREGEAKGKTFLDWVREDYSEDALRAAFKATTLAGFINDKILARE